MSGTYAIAANAFEETLEALDLREGLAELGDLAALGRRAALLAVAGAVWRRQLGPLLEGREVQELLGVGSRQAVSDLAKRGRLLALDAAGGRRLYPAFQFAESGRPHRDLESVLEVFAGVVESTYTTASWLVSPNADLTGETPIERLRSGRGLDELLVAARRAAARLAR